MFNVRYNQFQNEHGQTSTSWSSWDGHSYCDSCKGIGYKYIRNVGTNMFVCSKCNGLGFTRRDTKDPDWTLEGNCKLCDGSGFVDWIRNCII